MEVERVYYVEYCPECGQRACVTQAVDYGDGARVCPDAVDGATKCLSTTCCHGCECDRDDNCGNGCGCDCHNYRLMLRLRDDEEVIDLTLDDDMVAATPSTTQVARSVVQVNPPTAPPRRKNGKCSCAACTHRIRVREHDVDGVTVSNRPRDCLKFAKPGRTVITTYYNNEDGRNRRLDEFFVAKRQ